LLVNHVFINLIAILQKSFLLYRSAPSADMCIVNAVILQMMDWISALYRSSPAPVLSPSPGSPNTTLNGLWAALDSATGRILWETPSPLAGAMAVSLQETSFVFVKCRKRPADYFLQDPV
jgi:hypothetical protein